MRALIFDFAQSLTSTNAITSKSNIQVLTKERAFQKLQPNKNIVSQICCEKLKQSCKTNLDVSFGSKTSAGNTSKLQTNTKTKTITKN